MDAYNGQELLNPANLGHNAAQHGGLNPGTDRDGHLKAPSGRLGLLNQNEGSVGTDSNNPSVSRMFNRPNLRSLSLASASDA